MELFWADLIEKRDDIICGKIFQTNFLLRRSKYKQQHWPFAADRHLKDQIPGDILFWNGLIRKLMQLLWNSSDPRKFSMTLEGLDRVVFVAIKTCLLWIYYCFINWIVLRTKSKDDLTMFALENDYMLYVRTRCCIYRILDCLCSWGKWISLTQRKSIGCTSLLRLPANSVEELIYHNRKIYWTRWWILFKILHLGLCFDSKRIFKIEL